MNYGEISNLGQHRLMCGDATKPDDVAKLINDEKIDLVLTDPPYGMKISAGYDSFRGGGLFARDYEKEKQRYNQSHYRKIIGDNSTDTARLHYEVIKNITENIIFWGGNFFSDFLPVNKGWLVWHKHQTLQNHSDCELAWTSIKTPVRLYSQIWNGAIREGSNTLNPRPALHLSQKPVELHTRILEDFSKPGDIILDCFGGSGTTLIACEITNRKCLIMEISPEYCEIIKSRWENLMPLFNKNNSMKKAAGV